MKLIYRIFVIVMVGCLLGLIITFPSRAQAPCREREDVLRSLEANYDERVVAQAVTTTGQVIERLESRNGWTWTLIVTTPGNLTCPVAAGEWWQEIKQPEGTGS